jgi:hypothetical protein
MARQKKVTRIWPTMDVVAAACAAQRVNGEYVKIPYKLGVDGDNIKRTTNRELVYQYLEDESFVTDADRLLAEDVKDFYKGYTFKVLSGAYLSEFDRIVMKILEEEFTPSGYNVALLTSIPQTYIRAKERDAADRRTRFAQGGYVGNIGERLNLQVEVIKCVFSQKWGCYYITAMTTSDQCIFFGIRGSATAGTILNIVGTVKRQDNNQTQLNRVKVL